MNEARMKCYSDFRLCPNVVQIQAPIRDCIQCLGLTFGLFDSQVVCVVAADHPLLYMSTHHFDSSRYLIEPCIPYPLLPSNSTCHRLRSFREYQRIIRPAARGSIGSFWDQSVTFDLIRRYARSFQHRATDRLDLCQSLLMNPLLYFECLSWYFVINALIQSTVRLSQLEPFFRIQRQIQVPGQ